MIIRSIEISPSLTNDVVILNLWNYRNQSMTLSYFLIQEQLMCYVPSRSNSYRMEILSECINNKLIIPYKYIHYSKSISKMNGPTLTTLIFKPSIELKLQLI
jgi:hypothetical protein